MNTRLVSIGLAAALACLAGCNKAESPGTVQQDVAAARQDAAKDIGKAEDKASDKVAAANEDLVNAADKASEKAAGGAYDVAVTRAEADHKVSLKKCEAVSGDVQKACKDQADAVLKLAKADAEAAYPQRR